MKGVNMSNLKKNPDEDGLYDCPKCSSRKKDAYPKNKIDQPCARCIKEYYNLNDSNTPK